MNASIYTAKMLGLYVIILFSAGCDVFIPNPEVGTLAADCFGNGGCEKGLQCLESESLCTPSCRTAMNSVYEGNYCAMFTSQGVQLAYTEATSKCSNNWSAISECGCSYEKIFYLDCLANTNFRGSNCSACSTDHDQLVRCLDRC